VGFCFYTPHLQEFGADDAAVSLLEGIEKFARQLIASHLPLTVLATRLPFLKAGKNGQSGASATHHAQAAHATTEGGTNAEGHLLVQSVEVCKGTNHTLTASVALHEEFYGSLYAVFQLSFHCIVVCLVMMQQLNGHDATIEWS
jgi:hypothetical protein